MIPCFLDMGYGSEEGGSSNKEGSRVGRDGRSEDQIGDMGETSNKGST